VKAIIEKDGIHVYVENAAEEWAVKALLSTEAPHMEENIIIHGRMEDWINKGEPS